MIVHLQISLLNFSTQAITGGHNKKSTIQRCNKSIISSVFTHRITTTWNNIPNSVVNAPPSKHLKAASIKFGTKRRSTTPLSLNLEPEQTKINTHNLTEYSDLGQGSEEDYVRLCQIIKNVVLYLNFITLNLRVVEIVACMIIYLLQRVDSINHHLSIRQYTMAIVRYNSETMVNLEPKSNYQHIYKCPGGSMSQVIGLPNNAYKPITQLCKLQKGCARPAAASDKFTSCLSMVDGSLRVLRLLSPLKLVAMIQLRYC